MINFIKSWRIRKVIGMAQEEAAEYLHKKGYSSFIANGRAIMCVYCPNRVALMCGSDGKIKKILGWG